MLINIKINQHTTLFLLFIDNENEVLSSVVY